jgi:hypothetical protein
MAFVQVPKSAYGAVKRGTDRPPNASSPPPASATSDGDAVRDSADMYVTPSKRRTPHTSPSQKVLSPTGSLRSESMSVGPVSPPPPPQSQPQSRSSSGRTSAARRNPAQDAINEARERSEDKLVQLILAEDETVLMVQEVAERLIKQRRLVRGCDPNDTERTLLETNTERQLQEEHRMLTTQLKELRRVRADIDRKLKDLDQMETSLFAASAAKPTAGANRGGRTSAPSNRNRAQIERGSFRRSNGPNEFEPSMASRSSTRQGTANSAGGVRVSGAELSERTRREEATRQSMASLNRQSVGHAAVPTSTGAGNGGLERLSSSRASSGRQSTSSYVMPDRSNTAESAEESAMRRKEEMTRKKLIELRAQLATSTDSQKRASSSMGGGGGAAEYTDYLSSSQSSFSRDTRASTARSSAAQPVKQPRAKGARAKGASLSAPPTHGNRHTRGPGTSMNQSQPNAPTNPRPNATQPKRETDESEKRFLSAFERQRGRITKIRKSIAAAVVIQRAWRAFKARRK